MPYRLSKGIYAVRCRYPHCPFNDRLEVEPTIMGVTEEDVRSEAYKNARDKAMVKHDSIYGRRHGLDKPEIRMVSGSILHVGSDSAFGAMATNAAVIKEYGRGDLILRKGEAATTVCEVLQGIAYPARNRQHRYTAGDCFGAAALLPNHGRLSDILAGSDRTVVAFHDLAALRRSEPRRANSLAARVMEDTLKVVDELGKTVHRLRRETQKLAT